MNLEGPDVTAYRVLAGDAEKWKDVMAARGEAACYLLQRSEDSWIVYGRDGTTIGESKDVVTQHVTEAPTVVSVDRDLFLQDVREFMFNDDLSLLACSEGHVGASAADHSNFAVLCRRMILEANEKDIQHVFVVESRRWPCRVAGVVADLSRMSGEMTDIYIDRRQWLQKSWPLVDTHHFDVLADRLARIRHKYVMEVIESCGDAARFTRELITGVQASWMVAGPGAKYRCVRQVVELLRDGIQFKPREAEVFSEEILTRHCRAVFNLFAKIGA